MRPSLRSASGSRRRGSPGAQRASAADAAAARTPPGICAADGISPRAAGALETPRTQPTLASRSFAQPTFSEREEPRTRDNVPVSGPDGGEGATGAKVL